MHISINSKRWLELKPFENEIFKDIPNYEGFYQVSNYGRVKSLKRTYFQENGYGNHKHNYKERILKLIKHKQGYMMVRLSKNGKGYLKQVHRLVAQTFLNNYNEKLEVNHINAIKSDNKLENLEMCTRIENQRHAEQNNLIKRKYGKDNVSSKPIIEYDENMNYIGEYDSITIAGKENNINMKHLSYCIIHNKKDKIKSHIWKYKERND